MDLGGGLWGFRGFTTKAGTYLVTVKATLNGNTVTQRVALKVNALPAWAKGTFNGGIYDEAYARMGARGCRCRRASGRWILGRWARMGGPRP